MVRPERGEILVAVVEFVNHHAHIFGPPNEDVIAGHPLAARGLTAHDAHLVESSSWIRALERMNAVHPHHHPERFRKLKHFVFAFHASVFECAADGFSVTVHRGPLHDIVAATAARMR